MSSFMWPQFVFSKLIPRLLCQLALKLLEGLTTSAVSGTLEYYVFLGAISWPLVWLRLETENVWLESDCENKTLLKPLKWYFALKQIMTGELLMVETSCSIQTKSSDVVLCQTTWPQACAAGTVSTAGLTGSGFFLLRVGLHILILLALGKILFQLLILLDS